MATWPTELREHTTGRNVVGSNLMSRLSFLVEHACKASDNQFGHGIWTHHIAPMLGVAADLASRVGADQEIVSIAVLLHDYAGIVDRTKVKDHHIHGAAEAERILTEAGYPQSGIDSVKACILTHRGSVSLAKDTKEQQCVADADAIVHMQAVASLFFVAYHNLGMGIDEGQRWVKEKIERDWLKLSEMGKEVARSRYEALREILR